METLRTYLNSLPTDEQAAFAERCETTIGYLRKAISKKSKFDGALCRRLNEHSGGVVPLTDLRPDIWPKKAA